MPLRAAITSSWKEVHNFLQNNVERVEAYYPMFKTVMRTFDKKRFCGYVVEMNLSPNTLPYLVAYRDGDMEDLSEKQFQQASKIVAEFVNVIKTLSWGGRKEVGEAEKIDYSYWSFPRTLTNIYSRITRRFDLDAMEHPSGQTSKAGQYCSRLNNVFDHDLTGLATWCNPDFDQMKEFISHFGKSYEKDVAKTSLVLVVPAWFTKSFWPLLKTFRLLDAFPTGTDLFQSPDRWGDGRMISKGPTRWPTLVLYKGAEFSTQKLWKALQRPLMDTPTQRRMTLVNKRNYCLSGDPVVDESVVTDLLRQISAFGDAESHLEGGGASGRGRNVRDR